MKLIKRLALGVLGVVVLAIGGAYLLPASVHVERSIVIDAPPATVFDLLDSYERFNTWSPWFDRDPDAVYEYSGPTSGVGSKMRWSSDDPEVGNGAQEIIESDPPRFLKTELDFGPDGKAHATFDLLPTDTGVKVTWGLDADLGMNPIARYFGLAMDGILGPDYARGLATLKRVAEAEARSSKDAARPVTDTPGAHTSAPAPTE